MALGDERLWRNEERLRRQVHIWEMEEENGMDLSAPAFLNTPEVSPGLVQSARMTLEQRVREADFQHRRLVGNVLTVAAGALAVLILGFLIFWNYWTVTTTGLNSNERAVSEIFLIVYCFALVAAVVIYSVVRWGY